MEFYSRYNPAPQVKHMPEGLSMTKQSHKDECDINKIVKSYQRSGFDPFVVPQAQFSGEIVAISDTNFHEAMEVVAKANEAFDSMPSVLRKRFQNDPAQLLAFLQDSANLDEAVKLGLVVKQPEAVPQEKPVEPAPAV